MTLGGLLEDVGYKVRAAGSSSEALALLEASHFDLAVLDVRLDETDEGNTDGLDLAATVKRRWPKVEVIIITGYGTLNIIREALEPDPEGQRLASNYVPKTETEDLVRIVRETLN